MAWIALKCRSVFNQSKKGFQLWHPQRAGCLGGNRVCVARTPRLCLCRPAEALMDSPVCAAVRDHCGFINILQNLVLYALLSRALLQVCLSPPLKTERSDCSFTV